VQFCEVPTKPLLFARIDATPIEIWPILCFVDYSLMTVIKNKFLEVRCRLLSSGGSIFEGPEKHGHEYFPPMRAEKFLFAASKFKLERAAMKRKHVKVHDFIKDNEIKQKLVKIIIE